MKTSKEDCAHLNRRRIHGPEATFFFLRVVMYRNSSKARHFRDEPNNK